MKKIIVLAVASLISVNSYALQQQEGATGKINRMIVNHNANNDEIFITTNDPSPTCASMRLRTDDPNVSNISYTNLVSYLLAAKIADKTVQLYTDLECNLFRAEIIG